MSDTNYNQDPRQATAEMLWHLAHLLPPTGQPLPEQRRRQFLTVIERTLDYLYTDAGSADPTPDAPGGARDA